MFLWFVAGGAVVVLLVFQAPTMDYRLVAAATFAPEAFDRTVGLAVVGSGAWVRPWLGNALLLPVLSLAAVILIFRRGARRRQWLAVPIGLLVHHALDAAWSEPGLFWYPLQGVLPAYPSAAPLDWLASPFTDAGVAVRELAGLAALVFLVRRFDLLGEGGRVLVREGRLG